MLAFLGEFTIADAMYAPVVGHFKTYGMPMEGLVKDYCEAMMKLPAMQEDFIAVNHL
jgi:glutathione S-transferase